MSLSAIAIDYACALFIFLAFTAFERVPRFFDILGISKVFKGIYFLFVLMSFDMFSLLIFKKTKVLRYF